MNAMRNLISAHIDELNYQADKLRTQGTNEKLVDLLNRVITIGSISILYCDEITESELEAVISSMKLALSIVTPENKNDIDKNSEALKAIIERIEALYRSKKLLLDSEKKQKIS